MFHVKLTVSALDYVQKIIQLKMRLSVTARNAAVLLTKLGVIVQVLN